MSLTPALAPARVPDRSRRVVVQPFTPNDLCVAAAINAHFKIISERKTKAIGLNVAVTRHVAGELGLA